MSESRALVKVDLPARPVRSVEEFQSAVARAEQTANVLLPIERADYIPPMTAVSLRVVQLDPRPNQGDVYQSRSFCSASEAAITKRGLTKLWANAGGQVLDSHRMDDGGDPHYCSWQVTGEITLMDGSKVRMTGSKEIDLRDGSVEAQTMTDKQLREARRHIMQMAESKAMNRMIRSVLSVKQKYTQDDLAKPFVVPKLIFMPDMSDPDVKRAVLAQQTGLTSLLYGPGQAHPQHLIDTHTEETPERTSHPVPDQSRTEPAPVRLSPGDQDPDPWDQEVEATPVQHVPASLPIPDEVIAQADKQRAAYLRKINDHVQVLLASGSPDIGPWLEEQTEGIDWLKTGLEMIGVVGKRLADARARAEGGAA